MNATIEMNKMNEMNEMYQMTSNAIKRHDMT